MYRTRVPRVDETQSVLRSIGPMAYRFLRGQLILPAAVSATASFDPIWIRRHSMAGCEARNNRAAEGEKIALCSNLAVSSRNVLAQEKAEAARSRTGLGCALGRGYGFSRSARVSWRLLLNLELRRRAHQNSTRTSAQFGPRPFWFFPTTQHCCGLNSHSRDRFRLEVCTTQFNRQTFCVVTP